MSVNLFMHFMQLHCMHASDRQACVALLEAMQLPPMEKLYCAGALERRLQFIVPFLPHNLPPHGPDTGSYYPDAHHPHGPGRDTPP